MRSQYGRIRSVALAGLMLSSCVAPGSQGYASNGYRYIKMTNDPNPPPPRVAADIGAIPPGVPPEELPYWIKVSVNMGAICWMMNPVQLPVKSVFGYRQLTAPVVSGSGSCDNDHLVTGHIVMVFWNGPATVANFLGNLSGDTSQGRFEGLVKVGLPLKDPLFGTAERGYLNLLHP